LRQRRDEEPILIRVEHHEYGPRVYVLGQRVHEFALGLVVIAAIAVGVVVDVVGLTDGVIATGVVGAWLVIKDWRDLFPRLRNTSIHSRLAVHRPAGGLRSRRPGLPLIVAAATLLVAIVNAVSALTPNIAWRGRLLLGIEPISSVPIFHQIALPLSVVLGLASVYLYRRRRRAVHIAVVLLLGLAVLNIFKGLDVEEAMLDGALAFALFRGREAFEVEHEPFALRSSIFPLAMAGLALSVASLVSVWMAGRTDPSITTAAREAWSLLSWQSGPILFDDPAAPYIVRGLMILALVAGAWALFRPRRPACTAAPERRLAREVVREHGRDTLASFKLRDDLEYLFCPDQRAFLGYRVEGRVLLVAGDPVGPDDAMPALIAEARAFAVGHGLRLGITGASESAAARWRAAGFRSLYLGDEAIVDTRAFSLEGRAIRKVRQSVTRLVAAGFTASVEMVADLAPATLAELEAISDRWRDGEPERGFAMSIGGLTDGPARDGLVIVVRDDDRAACGWIHFLPSYGRPAMSLSLMRRDRDTPNGLTEFMVVRSIELLRERGVEELSLNFAAFARPLRSPRGRVDRVSARLLGFASRWFQIESLYRFNAKFFPRWEPRYLLYEGSAGLPAIGLAVLVAEGQLPRSLTALLRTGATAA
jgi:lysyl-tRNA synthetase class 2